MILAALKGLAALPRLVDAVESLGDIATVEMSQKKTMIKIKWLIYLIDAARERRLHKREAERVLRDRGEESGGNGGGNIDS